MEFPSYRIESPNTTEESMREFATYRAIRDIEAMAWIRFAAASVTLGLRYPLADHAAVADKMLAQFRQRFTAQPQATAADRMAAEIQKK